MQMIHAGPIRAILGVVVTHAVKSAAATRAAQSAETPIRAIQSVAATLAARSVAATLAARSATLTFVLIRTASVTTCASAHTACTQNATITMGMYGFLCMLRRICLGRAKQVRLIESSCGLTPPPKKDPL